MSRLASAQMATVPSRRILFLSLMLSSGVAACTESATPGGAGGLGGEGGSGGALVPSERFIRDDEGRALILHGLNISNDAKSDPQRTGRTSREFIAHMAGAWGFNVSRHLIFWDAIEPEPGVYDDEYLDSVGNRLDWYADAGVHVILDMHQDVYSQFFCCDGAPEWAIRSDGLPFDRQDTWWRNYFEPAVERAFDNFWDFEGPHADVQEAYVGAWLKVVQRFHDHPAVLGYDLMNEPHEGSMDRSDFEAVVLPAFYDRLIASVRDIDADNWIFYEPTGFVVNPGGPTDLGRVEDPRDGRRRLVYAPHLYDPTVFLGEGYQGPAAIDRWATNRATEIEERHPGPLFIGELGGGPPEFHHDVLAMADRMGSGWTRWVSDPFFDAFEDERDPDGIDELVRVYPQRIAGDPISYGFDPNTRVFTMSFTELPNVEGPTEIYIPEARLYPDGWALSVSDPDESWSSEWDSARSILELTTDPGQSEHIVRIAPADP